MKTLNKIKDEVAKKYGHINFTAFKIFCFKNDIQGSNDMMNTMTEIATLYAKEVAIQALKDASERATAFLDHNDNPIVVTKSILETPILIS